MFLPSECPSCHHTIVKAMPERMREIERSATWYQCCVCDAIWSLPKPGAMILGGAESAHI